MIRKIVLALLVGSASVLLAQEADLYVQKSSETAVAPDSDLAFFITVGNAGPSVAQNVVLTDNLPAPLTFVSLVQTSGPAMNCGTSTCTVATLPVGDPATFRLIGHVPADTMLGTEITNTATVASDNDPLEENNVGTRTVTVTGVDMQVAKTGPSSAIAGTTIRYEVAIYNSSPVPALNVVLTEPVLCTLPYSNCNRGTYPPGLVTVYVFEVPIPPDATSWSNTATVSTDSFDPDLSNNASTVVTAIRQSADVWIVKSGPATVVASTNLTYTMTVVNAGPSTASNVVLTETLPAGTTLASSSCGSTTCILGTLAPGTSTQLTFEVTVNPNATGPLTNLASITSSTPDPILGNNNSLVQTTVTPAPADLSVAKSADFATSTPGATATYTIVVTNNGPGAAANVVVTDDLPAGSTLVSSSAGCTGTTTVTCTVGTLAAGGSATIPLVVTLPPTPGTVVNTARASTTSTDPTPGNDSATAAIVTQVPAATIPALSPIALAFLALTIASIVLVVLRRVS
jgi:uncharacterized repeat protein (TIGR01451 family)